MEKNETKGAFSSSLKRTATEIKNDRADAISEDAETSYRRYIEDMKAQLKRLLRDRRNTLDLSPDDINSLKMGKDFDGEEFTRKDIEAGVKIRNLKVRIEIAEERYSYLFGDGEVEDSRSSLAQPGEVA